MSQSNEHQELICIIQNWCLINNNPKNYLIMADCDQIEDVCSQLPPNINNYRPDLVWICNDGKYLFIGEAKTRKDIKNLHTRNQIKNYLDVLENQKYGQLIVSVPFGFESITRSLINEIRNDLGYSDNRSKVISIIDIKKAANC